MRFSASASEDLKQEPDPAAAISHSQEKPSSSPVETFVSRRASSTTSTPDHSCSVLAQKGSEAVVGRESWQVRTPYALMLPRVCKAKAYPATYPVSKEPDRTNDQ
eukprot:scaffold1350_cov249-Pinguiococcus_pyrenoidosus.AAC.14